MREIFEATIERIFSDLVTPELMHQCAAGAWPGSLWQTLEDAEMTFAAVPEEFGGSGASWEDTYALIRAAGAHGVPAPFADTLLGNWLTGRAGLEPVKGPVAIAALPQLECSNGEFSGRLENIPWGRNLKRIVAVAAEPSRLVLLDTTNAVQLERGTNLAGEPRDTVTFNRARPIALAPLRGEAARELLLLCGAMVRSA